MAAGREYISHTVFVLVLQVQASFGRATSPEVTAALDRALAMIVAQAAAVSSQMNTLFSRGLR